MALDLVQLRKKYEKVRRSLPSHLPLTQETYCPRLWSEAFINDRAEVFVCCHMKPYSMGSLHEAPLRELWNGFAARQMRRLSLNKALLCYDRCRLLSEEEHAAQAGPDAGVRAPYEQLTRLKMLMGEFCNIACIMCDQNHDSRRELSVDLLKERVDFTNITDIELQGGEPMTIQSARDTYIWLTEELGKKVNFLTNGTVMPRGWPERLCRGSEWIYVSINGVEQSTFEHVNAGAKLDKIKRNVAKILDAREKIGSKLELVGHFTMVSDNVHEADRFPAFAKELGFDRVDYGFELATVPRWFQEHPEEKARMAKSFAEQLADPPVPINTKRLVMLGLVPPAA